MQKPEGQYLLFNPLSLTLPEYEGPLEALLDMIRKKKFSVYTVKLADICEPYLEYLEKATEINLELGAEFIEMAARLIFIKSRSLLPKHEEEEDEDEESEEDLNPEEALRKKLIELERFEQISKILGNRDRLHLDYFPRAESIENEKELRVELNLKELTVFRLLDAYREVYEKEGFSRRFQILKEENTLQGQIIDLILRIEETEMAEYYGYFEFFDKEKYILLFLAMLELSQKGMLEITQIEVFTQIYCSQSKNFPILYEEVLNQYEK